MKQQNQPSATQDQQAKKQHSHLQVTSMNFHKQTILLRHHQSIQWNHSSKNSFKKTIQKKEDEASIKQLHVSFPSDKPSFDLSILTPWSNLWPDISEERLLTKAEAIREKLAEFNIDILIDGFNVWPTVVQFKLTPDSGIKISKIESYQQDIALALKTKSLRVIAPIPWTDKVWIEIPNPKPQMVRLSETLWSREFTTAMSDNLTNLAIGKWIDGQHIVKPLEKMPHLLVAWATGSGKSVWVNDFISSLIYQNTPSELKFIMVDPKQVELGMYEGIPYLLAPIITQADKAIKVLRRAVDFMEERYRLLKEAKVRNLDEYNAKLPVEQNMYRLVIIIDELADLMMSGNKKDTETYIARIAQKARAVWIHLILATQRPSVNVITGIIKAKHSNAYSIRSCLSSR
jgi:DNA segregation ATPase FtsK/SpoIIIE, S-DNA-T family